MIMRTSYVYRNSDLSILKYDSLGHKKHKSCFRKPFKIQSVEKIPLNIFLFSENGQEIKILDQNLNEIQYLIYTKIWTCKSGLFIRFTVYLGVRFSSKAIDTVQLPRG